MSAEKSSRPSNYKPAKPAAFIFRLFGGLKVRQKLAILHNVFFFVLAVSVYLSVIPLFSDRAVRESSAGKVALVAQEQVQDRLSTNHAAALRQARIRLFAVLGSIYVLSIVVMEFIIMPQYVYQPLRLMLNADDATRRDAREHEMIDETFILDDEIGQIMRSRNATVAQLRRQEDDLANALKRLEEQDRLVSLGLLSTSVAHELNTPLAVLQGSLEKLVETTRDGHTLERLGRMLRVTQRLRKISEGLLDFARVRKQEAETVALRPLIDESWNLVAIDENAAAVTFENRVRANETIVGNPDRLVQVFVNLLRNALLAVSATGEICVQSKLLQRGGRNWVSCTVLDNGPGIPDHLLPNLFEAFVTTRLDARGTGLGLTVAEGIITQHGGTISAANRPEGGASLEVILPSAA